MELPGNSRIYHGGGPLGSGGWDTWINTIRVDAMEKGWHTILDGEGGSDIVVAHAHVTPVSGQWFKTWDIDHSGKIFCTLPLPHITWTWDNTVRAGLFFTTNTVGPIGTEVIQIGLRGAIIRPGESLDFPVGMVAGDFKPITVGLTVWTLHYLSWTLALDNPGGGASTTVEPLFQFNLWRRNVAGGDTFDGVCRFLGGFFEWNLKGVPS